MSNFSLFPFALGALASISAPALAQPSEGRQDRNAIIVTASRLATPLDASTAAISTLDAEDLARRQTVFVVDALATLPGVTVSQNGAFGGQASVRLRGASSEQTLVLVDGVVVNDPTSPGGGFNAAFLDANDIARIEVLRGPQSTLWGSDAIGGVINIITRRPQDGLSARIDAEAGSFQTRRAGGSFGWGGERADLRLGAAAITADGVSKADEDDGNPEEDAYDNVTFDGRLGLDLTQSLRLEAFGRYGDNETEFDGFGSATGVRDGDELSKTEELNGGVVARLTLFDGRFEQLLLVSRAEIERRNFSNGVRSFTADGGRDAIRYQGTVRATPDATIAFGSEREHSEFKQQGDTSIDGLFGLAEVKPVAGLTLTGGLRRDDHSTFGEAVTGRLGARWDARDGWGVRASWGQGFKAPTVFQVTGGGFVPANPNLQPEEAEGWDAAVFAAFFNGRLSAEIGAFDLETKNLISFTSAGYRNVARAESEGVEAVARFAAAETLTLSANYTLTDAIDAVTGRRLTRTPEHAAFLEAAWQPRPSLGLTVTVRYNGEETDSVRPANPEGLVAAWTRIDVAGRYRLSERLEVFGRIENLLDEDYQDVFGYGAPGLSAYGGIRVRLP